jgi:hypothetical protein
MQSIRVLTATKEQLDEVDRLANLISQHVRGMWGTSVPVLWDRPDASEGVATARIYFDKPIREGKFLCLKYRVTEEWPIARVETFPFEMVAECKGNFFYKDLIRDALEEYQKNNGRLKITYLNLDSNPRRRIEVNGRVSYKDLIFERAGLK